MHALVISVGGKNSRIPRNTKREFGLNKLEDLKAKIAELEKEIKELKEEANASSNNCDAKIVTSEEEIISLATKGYDCQPIGSNKWLMKKG